MYRIIDENPFADTASAREMMRKAFPPAETDTFFDAQDEALGRSFVNSCIPSAIFRDGEYLGRALDGRWELA